MAKLSEELRPLTPLFAAVRKVFDQTRWRIGMDLNDLVAEIVIAVARELSGPSAAVIDHLKAAEAGRDRLRAAVLPLLNAQEAMLQGWAESSDERRQELWRTLHERADYVRDALDKPEETP